MSEKRKIDHIKYAKINQMTENDFDRIYLEHTSIPSFDYDDIDTRVSVLGQNFDYPFYINAMTGGPSEASIINEKLARIANNFNIPFFLGSQSIATKDSQYEASFTHIRKLYPKLFIVANVSANASVKDAQKAIDMVKANALAIHLNPIQELVMQEGDRRFSHWESNIKAILKHIKVPVIVKEVGFGMSFKTLKKLESIGVKTIDVSGKGGTNFALIENQRLGQVNSVFTEMGISTVHSLLYAQSLDNIDVLASGGIRNAYDIIKSLVLGAKTVGMAKYFLTLSDLADEEAFFQIEKLIEEIKKIMILLDVKTVSELENCDYYFEENEVA